MDPSLRNPLTWVWFFLTATTLVSWWISRSGGMDFSPNAVVTVCVMAFATLKAHLVIWYFMEVRMARAWLKWTLGGWLLLLITLLLGVYTFV